MIFPGINGFVRGVGILLCLSGMLVTPASTTTTTTATLTVPATTTTTATTTTDDGCNDDPAAKCGGRPDSDCFGIYEPWAKVHCPLRCGFCPNKTEPCEDKVAHCEQYSHDDICAQDMYRLWVFENCRKFCNLCTAPTRPSEADHGGHWSETTPQDGAVRYACEGGAVELRWVYSLSAGAKIGDIQWFYEGGASRQMIAIRSNGHFIPLPGYSNRVTALGNAGLTIGRMTVSDSGNYTVEVHLYDAISDSTHVVLRRTVFVQISDDLMTTDGYLHVTQSPEAVQSHGQWAIELQCGVFTFKGDPAFQVEWITPEGHSLSSSDFSNNRFNLRLTNPVHGGNYTCRVPAQAGSSTCLNGNGTHKGEATIMVDKMDARFAILEKENSELKADNSQLLQRVEALERNNAKISGLESRTHKLEEASQKRAAFYAHGLRNTTTNTVTSNTTTRTATLIPSLVSYNLGGGYSSSSGLFMAPISGVYFLAATVSYTTNSSGDDLKASSSSSSSSSAGLSLSLFKDGSSLGLASVHLYLGSSQQGEGEGEVFSSVAPLQAVVHLARGQRVGLRREGEVEEGVVVEFRDDGTSFAGFLVYPDAS